MSRNQRRLGALGFLFLCWSSAALAEDAAGIEAGVQASCDDAVKARKFDDDLLDLAVLIPDDFDLDNFLCTLSAKNPGSGELNNGQKGVKVRFTGQVLDDSGNPIGILNTSGRTKKNGFYSAAFFLPDNAAAVAASANVSGSKFMNQAYFQCGGSNLEPCQPNNVIACMRNNRFQVKIDWEDESGNLGSGQGMVLNSSNSEARFYFVNPNSQDLLVQLVNNCSNNDHFWVFYSATTSVEFDLTVTDTLSGESRTYGNPLGQAAPAVTDTSAFATCP